VTFARLRTQGGRHLFTVKRPLDNEMACVEHETEVTDRVAMHQAVLAMGFVPTVRIVKVRRTAVIGDVVVCVDDVEAARVVPGDGEAGRCRIGGTGSAGRTRRPRPLAGRAGAARLGHLRFAGPSPRSERLEQSESAVGSRFCVGGIVSYRRVVSGSAAEFGGTFRVNSEPGTRTRFESCVPLT
jgi:hypothetical protein